MKYLALILLSIVFMIGCEKKDYPENRGNYQYSEVVEVDGHKFIVFNNCSVYTMFVIHHPDCQKCRSFDYQLSKPKQ